jgi:hypothetical protein
VWDGDAQPSILLYAAYVPYELFVGIWLLVKGSSSRPAAAGATTSEPAAGV